jgi:hypothetical protein
MRKYEGVRSGTALLFSLLGVLKETGIELRGVKRGGKKLKSKKGFS